MGNSERRMGHADARLRIHTVWTFYCMAYRCATKSSSKVLIMTWDLFD